MNNLLQALLKLGLSWDFSLDSKDTVIIDSTGIEIHLSNNYWRYPGLTCYFVNWSNGSGSFTCGCGTPYLERAIFEIGQQYDKT